MKQLKLLQKRKLTANRLLEVGAITGSHGLKGALTIFSHTRPAIGIAGYSFWWVGNSPESAVRYNVERCWAHGGGNKLLVRLEGVGDCNTADALNRQTIWIDASEVDVDDDEYLWDELIGFKVMTTDGEILGKVDALVEFGAQDNLCVVTTDESSYAAGQAGEWMLPFIEDVVMLIDDERETIEVELPEGMDACFTPRS